MRGINGKGIAGRLLPCVLILLLALSGCGKKDLSVQEYETKIMKARTAEKQLELLNGLADRYGERILERWSDRTDPEIGKGLPGDLLIGTDGAEKVRALPDGFLGKKWIVLLDDNGTTRMYGELFAHMPAEMRARSLREADAVLLVRLTEIPFDRTEGGAVKLSGRADPNGIRRTYAFYAAERGSAKTYETYSTLAVPSDLWTDGKAAKVPARDLWERAMHCIPSERVRTLKEDEEYFRSLERPDEQLDALLCIAEAHAEEYSAADRGAELCAYIYSGSEDVQETMRPFVPDFETKKYADPLPGKLADRKYLCLEIRTDTGGNDSVSWRGGLYARLPERMRAETLDEADAVLIVHGYQAKQAYQGYYYYSPSNGTFSFFEYVGRSETLLYDLTDGTLYRTGWGARDAEIWPAFCAALVPDAENAGLDTADPSADPFAEGKAYEAGDTLFFGTFEQDGDPDDGAEPIEWIVLDAKDGELLLVSRYSLALMPFNERNANIRWEESGLYAWLNGTFLDGAFGAEERKRILPPGGGEGEGEAFLLSFGDVLKYMPSRFARICERTPASDTILNRGGNDDWWTSDTDGADFAKKIGREGGVDSAQMRIDSVGVRPAIRVNPAA